MLIHPTRHHSRQCAAQHRIHTVHRHHIRTHQFVDPRHSKNLRVECETRLLSPDKSKLSTAATNASDFLAFESPAVSAASHHCVQTASAK